SNDAVHISYFDGANDDLKYATDKSGSWATTTVDSTGDVGRFASIALDSNDAVHISYYDNTNDDLKYIALDSSSNMYGYSISPSLPAGLSLNAATGEISGTPTELSTNTTYTITVRNSGGTDTTTITIVVNDEVPTLSYSPDDLQLTNNTASVVLPLIPTLTGSGTITSWEINSTLPSGILFGSNNGTFYGTPTELWTTTAYKVWANNTGGTAIAYLNITVVDEVPTVFTYSPDDLQLTNNTASLDLPLAPTLTGPGEILTWELNNTNLPSGISFGSNNGTFYGTPTELWTTTAYKVWANNTGGSVEAYLNITVVDEVPTLSYSPDDLQLTNNTASVDLPLTPTITGSGAITSWELNNTNLPSGILFGASNGTFYGTPTELWTTTAYKVWANNTGGSVEAYLNITVVDEVPTDFTYSPDDLQLTNNTASVDLPLVPQLTGPGEILTWEINATLPSGILFGSSNGTFYGTPTELWPTTAYTVWANNTGGSVEAYLNITVVDEIPTSINYPVINLNLTNNTASPDLPLTPQITGPGSIISWEISGALPQGLTFDSNTGEISGIPTELWPTTNYTVWANNTGGSVEIEFNITVVDQLPTDFSYSPENLTLTNNTVNPELPLTPTLTGPGEITGWQINASLPTGLNFGNNNGTIWGIPTVLQLTPVPYTIWANNTGGSISAIINITILEVAPTLDYNPDDYNFTRNVTIGDIVPNYTPLNLIDSWEISPGVPLGLTFENGTISGTPTVNSTKIEYTVWANNSGGSAFATFNITIVEPTGSFAYIPDDVNLTRGQAISPMSPNYNGGAIENWSIYPDLPTGLIFENGTISGTPTVNSTKVNYTVYANNSGGSATAIISITINEPVSSIIYVPDERNETRTISMTPWFPQVTGGMVETWEIYPDLPLGLTFVDGVISGTPTVNSTRTNYTVWANNTGGSASTMINLTVVEPVVQLSYPNYELTLIRNVTMAPLMPQLTGGNAETWEISPDLPNGINFTDGMIWGTPLVNSTRIMYTIWANNTGGSTNISLNITVLEPSANIVYDPTNLVLTRGEAMVPAVPEVDGGSIEAWEIDPELPAGLTFDNGTISGTPTVNMTTQTYLIYANNSGGSAFTAISITILEPAPTIEYAVDSITLTRGESSSELPLNAIFGGGAISSFTIDPELPTGLNFTNGTISGIPLVNSTIIQYNISAFNNGGSDYFLLNITIVEPVAILAADPDYYELIRGESEMNLTINNTGGMVETWTVYPDLPAGLVFGNGTITGVPTVNASLATYKIFANNSGGSTNITINIKIFEPAANISYPTIIFTLINGQDTLFVIPEILGGNPETWEFEPELPDGITFTNGVFSGIPTENLTTTTYTIWANNTGGVSSATIELTINQPFYVARYPITLLVLNISENMPVLEPIYYFDEDQEPTWTISPELPDGLFFIDGAISGTPTKAQNLSTYTVTVSGEMVPATFFLMIEILEEYVEPTIQPMNNTNNSSTEIPTDLEPTPEPEPSNIAYWLCPIFLIFCLWLFAMIYNLRNKEDDVELSESPNDAVENEGKE
ncbi:MAG: putative Ig domain-containing protein, partial [Candidatus Poseidoniaceae archaeon]|nr:putative Ig domain-containing protein [Candidatus Poseidoniaceae archaeon]